MGGQMPSGAPSPHMAFKRICSIAARISLCYRAAPRGAPVFNSMPSIHQQRMCSPCALCASSRACVSDVEAILHDVWAYEVHDRAWVYEAHDSGMYSSSGLDARILKFPPGLESALLRADSPTFAHLPAHPSTSSWVADAMGRRRF